MIRREKNSLSYWTFPGLDRFPELRHAVFPAKGPEGGSFSLSFGTLPLENVLANLALAEKALGLGPAAQVRQAHGKEALVLEKGQNCAPRRPEGLLEGFDALAGGPGCSLMVKVADCQGVILWDPETQTAAAVHSGWRGSALNILGHTIKVVAERRGVRPGALHAAVSPSIGPCCMEFKGWRELLPEVAKAFVRGESHVDFWAMTEDQLRKAGVRGENIEFAGVCTRCGEGFFSHRRGASGRFGVMCGVPDAGASNV